MINRNVASANAVIFFLKFSLFCAKKSMTKSPYNIQLFLRRIEQTGSSYIDVKSSATELVKSSLKDVFLLELIGVGLR